MISPCQKANPPPRLRLKLVNYMLRLASYMLKLTSYMLNLVSYMLKLMRATCSSL